VVTTESPERTAGGRSEPDFDPRTAGPRRVLTAGRAWTAVIVIALVAAVLGFGDSEGPRTRRVVREPGEVSGVALVVAEEHRDVATALLGSSGLGSGSDDADVEVHAVESIDEAACSELLDAGRLVVMATLEVEHRELRSCLVGGGAVVVAFDALGDLPPSEPGAGEVVSTRRGYVDNLVDLVRWGLAEDVLDGSVGLVGLARDDELVEAAELAIEGEGLGLVDTALVGEDGADVDAAASSFVDAGIDTVVLSLPADLAGEWAVAHRELAGDDVTLVSGDAYDLAVAEDLPGAFDGALLHTSRIGPWATRDRPNVDQRRCADRFEAAGGGAFDDLEEEAQTVAYGLCQHLDMVDAAVSGVGRGATISESLRSQTVRSPLTSFLQGRADGGFGPTQDVVTRWSAECGCFEVERPYATR